MKKYLTNQLGLKFAIIAFLFLLLQIPMVMISSLISDRENRQESVIREIASSSSDEQLISGPFIKVDYKVPVKWEDKIMMEDRHIFILPDSFNLNAHLDSFEKYRGIYKAHLYNAQTKINGQFNLSAINSLTEKYTVENATFIVAISDSRGLLRLNEVSLNGEKASVEPGTLLSSGTLSQGFHHQLDINKLNPHQPLAFNIDLLLQGTGKLKITPIGKQTDIQLTSTWAHPSFVGDYLPISSTISEQGFEAKWASNYLSTNINQLFEQCINTSNRSNCREFNKRQMGVSLIEPVDHYLKSHRSINYSMLVVTLIFASFFLLEIFQARPIHPIQYGFVGLALAVFYLLLISMSEHIGFNLSYLLSALASTGVLATYVAGMLNKKQGILFGTGLIILYLLLFGLLQAESYALLMGALLCFAMLSFIMILTRKINWYEKSANMTAQLNELKLNQQELDKQKPWKQVHTEGNTSDKE